MTNLIIAFLLIIIISQQYNIYFKKKMISLKDDRIKNFEISIDAERLKNKQLERKLKEDKNG